MKLYTVHAAPPPPPSWSEGPEGWPEPKVRPPVLVPEGFSLAATILGPFWFAWNRLWWEALALLVLVIAAAILLPEPVLSVTTVVLHLLAGFEARDRLRARLARIGLPERGVVVADSLDTAWFRLGQQRPDLVRSLP
ncbi:DUF2628 domain-containing protein [Falsiroseomonas ponticola]|uniref:DUF2628 domain-containing protein n=1 Tax=Falsiroseomonas ponticola TaxID=2786951 RepID=UPI0019338F24|nr:DUF2628 domain-containing protein [Roseomonas ponticola]